MTATAIDLADLPQLDNDDDFVHAACESRNSEVTMCGLPTAGMVHLPAASAEPIACPDCERAIEQGYCPQCATVIDRILAFMDRLRR